MERKAAALELKADGPEGSFRATFSSFNVIDKDGDVTLPNAFQRGQKVRIAQWGHDWGSLPIGKGTIDFDSERAWVDGEFFLDTTAGADSYKTIKNLADLQEWSYGFQVTSRRDGQQDGRDVRFLEAIDVFEVSPVMLGAGIGTRTDFVKSALSFEEESEHALAGMQAFSDRARALAALRGKEGRTLSEANRERVRRHLETLTEMRSDLEELLAATEPPPKSALSDLQAEALRYEAIRARLLGVA